jgi:hypothetical protein
MYALARCTCRMIRWSLYNLATEEMAEEVRRLVKTRGRATLLAPFEKNEVRWNDLHTSVGSGRLSVHRARTHG